jgi:hypothetical protein
MRLATIKADALARFGIFDIPLVRANERIAAQAF